jgi:tetratricopeptide (TPR) repeat protein
MPKKQIIRASWRRFLPLVTLVVVCSLVDLGSGSLAGARAASQNQGHDAPASVKRQGESSEFDELNKNVLRLIQATEFAQALQPALRALQIAQSTFASNDDRLANISNSLGVIYKNIDDYNRAEHFLTAAESIWQKNDNQLMAAYADNNLGTLYQSLLKFDESEKFLKRAYDIRRGSLGSKDPLTVATLHNLALTLIEEGRLAEGEEKMREVIQARKELLGPENVLTLSSIGLLGYCLIQESRFQQAGQVFRDLIEVYRVTKRTRQDGYLGALNNLAVVLIKQGSYQEVADLLRELADIQAQKLGAQSLTYSVALTNLGRALYLAKDYSGAERSLDSALVIQRAGKGIFSQYEAISLNNLGAVYLERNQDDIALATFGDALEVAGKTFYPKHQFFSLLHRNVARTLANDGRLAEALEEARKALTFVPKDNASQALDIAAGFGMSGSAYEDLYDTFISISKKVFDSAPERNSLLVDEALRASQLASLSKSAAALFLMSARFTSGDPAVERLIRRRQDLIEKWHALNRQIIFGLSRVTTRPESDSERRVAENLTITQEQIVEVEEEIANAVPRFAELVTPRPLEISRIQELLREDEVMVISHVSVDDTFLWFIRRNEVRWRTVPLGVTPIGDMVKTLRCGLDDQEWVGLQRVARCERLLKLGEPPDKARPLPFKFAVANELYQALFGRDQDIIKGKKLLIVQSGPLTELPFQVLVTNRPMVPIGLEYGEYGGIAWFAKEQTISVLPSVGSLRWLRSLAKMSAGSKEYTGFGNPVLRGDDTCPKGGAPATCGTAKSAAANTASRGIRRRSSTRSGNLEDIFRGRAVPAAIRAQVETLCPLPDTAFEIRCVAEDLGVPGTELYLGEDATEANLKALSASGALAEYRVIHFATHGLLAGDVETIAKWQAEPSLVMTPPKIPMGADDDGLLTASEVARLNLNADWVILSACNTAAGESMGAEALSGLARAFFYAGARALLVSHWPVYSDAAVRLVNSTFEQIRASKVGRAEALRSAVVSFIDDNTEPDNAHPSVWAPFVLVGEGAN